MKDILFFDLETGRQGKIRDIGAWFEGTHFHDADIIQFERFLNNCTNARYVCGHNIFHHDLPVLKKQAPQVEKILRQYHQLDTLYLSALLFPRNPYHKLVKDYKLVSGEPNNPVSDCKLTLELIKDIFKQFVQLDPQLQTIYYYLLKEDQRFRGLFVFLRQAQAIRPIAADNKEVLIDLIKKRFKDTLCIAADINGFIAAQPMELAYALALLSAGGSDSVFPAWLVHRCPELLAVLHRLRSHRCQNKECAYCSTTLDPHGALKRIYGFDSFRRFSDDVDISLQEKAVLAALDRSSFLAVFPTGGGKSLTFQLPALMKHEAVRGLTVVISPLQSLMKDQVDVLKNRHERTDAVAINGLLSPLERAEAIRKVESGAAGLLYISPESLRSNTILRLLENRTVERFVIDEAHCLSSWGQDFRSDYLYIGRFIGMLEKKKKSGVLQHIPVSCFTATAKPQVVADIKRYFIEKTNLDLEVFQTAPKRENLSYGMYYAASPKEKFSLLLDLLEQDDRPKIVYTTRVKRSRELAEGLQDRGIDAAAYNGKLNSDVKIKIQNGFMAGKIAVIVATSAFGMGIDKDDVSMVIHYDISDSLENYMQEAGRAGRDEKVEADCFILFDDNDLMDHFTLLCATRINRKEIYQVWQGIKKLRKEKFSRSALELARLAGWDVELEGWETRMKTAITALEESGFIERGQDRTRIFATGLLVKNMEEASAIIRNAPQLDESDRLQAIRIIKLLISYKSCGVDMIGDILGISKFDTRRLINRLKELHIIGDDRDLTAYVDPRPGSASNSLKILEKFSALETRLLEWLDGNTSSTAKKFSLIEVNSFFRENNIESDIESLRTLLFSWESRRFIKKKRLDRRNHFYHVHFIKNIPDVKAVVSGCLELARHVLDKLISIAEESLELRKAAKDHGDVLVEFSIGQLRQYAESNRLFKRKYDTGQYDKTLLYLNDIAAVKLDKGLFVYYNPYSISRCSMDNKRQYTHKDYNKFETFYRHKIEQIHIAGEYAKKLSNSYKDAMTFVDDYFQMEYAQFIKKHFPRRKGQISKPITGKRFREIFKALSPAQLAVIDDSKSKAILVAAGPGSGKTRVLVHKVASLLTLEDIKTEQFLMLTYSRAAALEMRERLKKLVKNTAHYIDIYTFHSFAFSVAELKGDLEQSADIIPRAKEIIESGRAAAKVENKSVLVIDEFQDIGPEEFDLIRAIIDAAKNIRILAVGDDDQNIFQFRGASTVYMKSFQETFGAKTYHLNTNYRSKDNLVHFSNTFIKKLPDRIKADQTLVSSVPGENGKITITRYPGSPLITPMVADIVRQGHSTGSSTAVLTATNDEALLVHCLLRQEGIKAKLLVSYADFSLDALVELKMFSHYLATFSNRGADKVITKECWVQARKKVMEKFSRSKQLALAAGIIDSFEKEYTHLSLIDWREYLAEVKLEDFIFPEKGTIWVSTMHKAKGKEFDRVFLLLDNYYMLKDDWIRVLYVAITRAKDALHIHTNNAVFDNILVPGLLRKPDNTLYAPPDRYSVQLTYRDVWLDFFTRPTVVKTVKNLQAGDSFTFYQDNPIEVWAAGQKIAVLSNSGLKKMQGFFDKGYAIQSIHAEYIVIWKRKEDDTRYRVVLPRIELVKKEEKQDKRSKK